MKDLHPLLLEVLENFAKEHNVKLTKMNSKHTDAGLNTSISFTSTDYDALAAEFDMYATSFGLPAGLYGKTFDTEQLGMIKITGWNNSKRKYKVQVRSVSTDKGHGITTNFLHEIIK